MNIKKRIFSIIIPAVALLLGACQSANINTCTSFNQPGTIITTQPDKENIGDTSDSVVDTEKKHAKSVQKRTNSGALIISKSESVSQPVKPLKYFTKVAQTRIPLHVIVRNCEPDFSRIGKNIAGNIANQGFEVTDDRPFLTVAIENGSISQFDKLGNYYLYEAEAEISIHRNIYDYVKTQLGNYHMLANNTIISRGTRQLAKSKAVKSAAKELSKEASNWVTDVCRREMAGVKGEKVYLNTAMLKMAFAGFFNNTNSFVTCMNQMMKEIVGRKGILYCIESGRTDRDIVIEIMYNRKDYPNGVFKPAAMSDITFYTKTLNERVNELLGYLLR